MLTDGAVLLWVGNRAELPDLPLRSGWICRAGWSRRDWWIVIATRCLAATGLREFEMRLNGASYAEIAAGGGRIASTVNATRQASESQLLESARQRIRELCRDGVTALEIKSGYGLDLANERKCCG